MSYADFCSSRNPVEDGNPADWPMSTRRGRGCDPDLDPDFEPPAEPEADLESMDIDNLIDHIHAFDDEDLVEFIDNAVINHVSATVYRVATMELLLRFRMRPPTKKSA